MVPYVVLSEVDTFKLTQLLESSAPDWYIALLLQSLVLPEKFQHILRILNTNIDGRQKIMFAVTSIKGVGRRYSNVVLKKADINVSKRAGELSEEEVIFFYILK